MAALGIIAGGGELPIAIAESVRDRREDYFVVAIEGMADKDVFDAVPHAWSGIGQLGKTLDLLKKAGCDRLTFAGRVTRPEWKSISLDGRGMMAVAKVAASALLGDDNLMRTALGLFEKEGFKVIGTAEAAPDLIAPEGVYGRLRPDTQAEKDMALAAKVVRRMGELDIGQAAAVADGLVLAVEAAEGTDAMLARLKDLPLVVRGSQKTRRGVLVKSPKPRQERRVDLPVIGVRTVELAAEGGLAGIAVEAGSSLIMRKSRLIETADRLGLFVMGYAPGRFADE
ncbi:MAG: UDP-2,3-diacylglucosamine diphosphatase LpxI [Proteobacteria bacterium]|nr:UDP-2,3-diacylglucosamine diphosphatase LpxI [Pseudomonadota bacterium]